MTGRRRLSHPLAVTAGLLAFPVAVRPWLPADDVGRALLQGGLGATALGVALFTGYRRSELGLGPGLGVLAAGVPLLAVVDGDPARRALLHVPLGTVLFEEALFRGVLWAVLRRTVGPRVAVGWHAAVFGLWHVTGARADGRPAWAVATLTALAGVGFARLREGTGSLIAPALAHWAINAVGVAIATGVRGSGGHGEAQLRVTGEQLVVGQDPHGVARGTGVR